MFMLITRCHFGAQLRLSFYDSPPSGGAAMDLRCLLDTIGASDIPSSWRKSLCYKTIEMAARPQASSSSTAETLANYEPLMPAAQEMGESSVAGLALRLRRDGQAQLAHRLRSATRHRGSVARPDPTILADVMFAAEHMIYAEPPEPDASWRAEDLRDDRVLRHSSGVTQETAPPLAAEHDASCGVGAQSFFKTIASGDMRLPMLSLGPSSGGPHIETVDAPRAAAFQNARVESLQAQFDMLAEMQVQEGQSFRREIDVVRNEALKGIDALEGELRTLAVAECVEERDKDLVRDFTNEAMAGRAAITELHDRFVIQEAHIEDIRKEFKSIYDGMSAIDLRIDVLQRQVDEQQALEMRRERADLGMMAFAQRIEARVDEAQSQIDGTRSQVDLVSQGVERLLDHETSSVERMSRIGCVVSALLASARGLSDRMSDLERSTQFSSGGE